MIQIDENLAKTFLVKFETKQQMKDWIFNFVGLDFPDSYVYEESNSSPLDWMFDVYQMYKNNTGDKSPEVIVISSRESYKTLSEAVFAVIAMVHFGATIAHMAAIVPQATAAQKYIESFIQKIQGYLTHHNITLDSKNSKEISIMFEDKSTAFMRIIVCTVTGANSSHTNIFTIDEIDTIRSKEGIRAYGEAKFIPGFFNGQHPITIKTSTLKFPGGLFSKEITNANKEGWKTFRWNILDITEYCPPTRHKPNEAKEIRYVSSKSLPLSSLTTEQYEMLNDKEREKYEKVELMAGCAKCKLAPVCKGILAKRKADDIGGLWKSIDFTISQFQKTDPDLAEAQLMCFSGNTPILMYNGEIKPISDINVGDIVISHTGTPEKVTKIFKREYSGPAFSIKNNPINWLTNSIVTSEHPFFINGTEFLSIKDVKPFKFSKFGELKSTGDYLSLPIGEYFTGLKEINYEEFVKNKENIDNQNRLKQNIFTLDYDFGWIIGFFLAEGFFHRRQYSDYKRLTGITFCTHTKETVFQDKVRLFANKLGLTTSELTMSNGTTQDIYCNKLAQIFKEICGEISDKKSLHKDLLHSNKTFIEGVFNGFYDGDGTKRHNSYKELTTTSSTLAGQLFLIAAKLGLCPRIKKQLPKNRKPVYRINCLNLEYQFSQKRTKYKTNSEYNLYRFNGFDEIPFSGTVFNLEVEKTHSYIASGVSVHNCWKPSTQGLVYPRFLDRPDGTGNTYTLEQAWKVFTGTEAPRNITLNSIKDLLISKGIKFYVGVDWGYAHAQAFVVSALLPNKEWWILDAYSIPGLEFDQVLDLGKEIRDNYKKPYKWFYDTAQPMFIKTFKKNGMPGPEFKKDVAGGIAAVRTQIINAKGERYLKVIKSPRTEVVLKMFAEHCFMLDSLGNLTDEPDDSEVADIADAIRYKGQNMFSPKGKNVISSSPALGQGMLPSPSGPDSHKHEDWMSLKIRELTSEDNSGTTGKTSDGKALWSFGKLGEDE